MSEIKNPAVTSDQSLPLLKVKDLHVYYGAIHAVKGISLEVHEGEIVTLIGANGAGKSTTLNTIAGLLKPRQGSIVLGGVPVDGTGASKMVFKGLSLCPEGRFPGGCLRPLPPPKGARKADRRNAFRRRAADARHGPCAHEPPEVAYAG